MENGPQVTKYSFEVLFCPVQNGPGVTWVSCIGLRKHLKWSFGCARAFLEAFLDLRAWNSKKNMVNGYLCFKKTSWPSMAPNFHDFHILTDSLTQAKLDIIHCC